ncbi:MAG: hypothetical protein E7300_03940 [Lachnospiraceae bacterium]|nr:hypothetical protein [Lachnospiraceae bacterium]
MNNRSKNVLWGVLLIALAASLILWKLNILILPSVFAGVSIFALALGAIMLIIMIHSIIERHYGGIFFPLAVICILFDKPLGITAITPMTVLIAALLLSIAFHMIFPTHHREHTYSHGGPNRFSDKFSESFNESENGSVIYSTRFGSSSRYVRSQNLCSADLSAQFGEMSVFFDKAEVPGKAVKIDCQVSFGAMNIYIPENWVVENRTGVTLGHCDMKGTNPVANENTVSCTVIGSVAFGELKIIRVGQYN